MGAEQAAIEGIARDVLGIPTLEARDPDSLDFRELAVWKIKEALRAAYAAGKSGEGQTPAPRAAPVSEP